MLTESQFYELAKIIDGDFIDSRATFTSKRTNQGHNFLTTNKCDEASNIKVYYNVFGIFNITRCAEDTDGYENLQPFTIKRIKEYLNTIKIKNTL